MMYHRSWSWAILFLAMILSALTFWTTITVRPQVPWFNDTASKREHRKYERVWRATGLESDKAAFNRTRNHTNNVIEQAKREC